VRAPELPTDDLYARLELPPDAAPEAIEIAWRSLLKRHHPDVAGDASLEVAKRINIAHDWLADPELRARYDRSRAPRAGRARSATASGRARPGPPDAPRRSPTAHRHDDHEGRAPDIGLGSPVVLAFLDRVAALGPDEIDRLSLAEPPPLAFVASIRRFLPTARLTALDALEAVVANRLPPAARAVPAVHDAVTSYGQYLILEGFLADLLSDPFHERVEERMTRGWLAAVGRRRYGPRSTDVAALVTRARGLSAADGARLAEAATALGISDRLWPHGTDPEEDEVLRVSATLAARDAAGAARAAGANARTQGAVAAFARVLALAPAFGPTETARLMRPWSAIAASRARNGGPRRLDER
jgi:hypothetical protein